MSEVRVSEVRVSEVRAAEVRAVEVRAAHDCLFDRILNVVYVCFEDNFTVDFLDFHIR